MGCQVDITATGVEVEIHKFDTRELAKQYLTAGRGYVFDKHQDWAFTPGFDFYNGRVEGERATLRNRDGLWHVCFWINGDARIVDANPFEGKLAWNGEYRIADKWFPVTNGDGRAICYASMEAALAGAKFSLSEVQHNTIRSK